MLQAPKKYYTPQEYLALEEKAESKSEYFRGQIYQMTGSSFNHNRVTFDIAGLLYSTLSNGNCEAFAGDMRLLVKSNGLYTYPNVMVICGPLELAPDRTDTATNPTVIIEVLSDSTAEYDRTDKFELYKGQPTLENYILVDQHRAYIQCFQKSADNKRIWFVETYSSLDETLQVPALKVELPLKQIYARVDWTTVPSDHPVSNP